MSSVYLAGKISGVPYADIVDWREEAHLALADVGIQTLSPMRGKEFLEGTVFTHDDYHTHLMTEPSAIVARDRWDVMNCDLMLVNLNCAPTMGRQTCVEFGWADAWRKPIIMVDKIGIAHALFVELAGFKVQHLDEGLEVCKSILLI